MEFAAAAFSRAAVLQRHCSRESDFFVIAHGDSIAFFVDLFAVWAAGACAVCIHPALPATELANVLDFVRPRAVLVDDASNLTASVPVLCLAREARGLAGVQPADAVADDPALVLFTSGTTGDPKGVVLSHRALQARVALNHAHLGPAVLRRTLCVLPTHFGHGLIGNCLTPLMAGGQLFLMPGAGVSGARQLGDVVERHDISFMSSVPAYWKLALKLAPPPRPGVLQRVHIGSAPLSADLWRGVMAWAGTHAVANMYGMTETANWAGGALATEFEPEDGLLGRPWGGHFAIRGDDGCLHAEGQGEILVKSASLMSGYLRRPDLTAAVMTDGWYRSGDIGSLGPDGVLRITGRARDMINRGGVKVHPEDLDRLFESHSAVAQACAFAMPDEAAGEAVGLAVRLREGAQVRPRELLDWARERLRGEALPSRIFFVDDIAGSERGKLQRRQVAQHCLRGDAAPVAGAPR